jgi:drug/metabolite transporter (DMT)-like permease
MTVILLSLASAAAFGTMTVAIRLGLVGGNAATGALAMLTWSSVLTVIAALPQHDLHRSWEFFLAGLLAPGCSQVLFTRSVREAGPSRTSVTVGAAPLVAVAIALVFLNEPVRTLLVLGALAVVGGGVMLAVERDRPEHVRAVALFFAVGATVFFAVRDNIVRALHAHANPEAAAAATMLAGLVVTLLWARRAPSHVELKRLAPAGICFGVSYVCLFEAYFRGRVSVVSPLVATETLWGVGLSALLLTHERIGRRLALGAALIVLGGVLIGLGQ